MTSSALATFSEKFPTDKPPSCLWRAIKEADAHPDSDEKRAIARSIIKDILKEFANDYINAYYDEVSKLYPCKPFGAYIIGLFNQMPTFANRASKKRSRTVLGWTHLFLIEASETELAQAFEQAISHRLP